MTEQQNEPLIIDFTSSAVVGENGGELVRQAVEACAGYGFQFGIQLHNTSTLEKIEKAASFGVPLSIHAPLLSDFLINLGAESPDESFRVIDDNAKLMRRFGCTKAVFHGFTMTDKPVPAFGRGRSYDECMQSIFRPELCLPGSRICRNFFDTDEFRERNGRIAQRLEYIREQYPDLTFCIENDFPAYGSAALLPEAMRNYNHPMCLDSSHLWASAFVFDRDFKTEVKNFLSTGKIEMVHLHASKYDHTFAKEEWSDGHLPLSTSNRMDLPWFVSSCKAAGCRHIVLEIVKGSIDDIHIFAKMWNTGQNEEQ